MKKLLLAIGLMVGISAYAQEGSVGIGTQTPNEKAVLHLVAPNNDQGLLIPKLTTVQRTNFSSQLTTTENGMMVYDSDLDQFFFWLSDHWEAVGSSLQAGEGLEIVNGVINNTGDTDASDDFSGDWADLINVPAGFSDGVDEVDDADNDPVNELQDLDLTSNILTITGIGSPTQINLASYTGTNTDAQDLQFTTGQITLTGDPDNTTIDLNNYDSDVTDDFSGTWADLAGIPTDFSDGIDDVDDADNDPTNEIELPGSAASGEVLKYNGTGWAAGIDNVDDGDTDDTNELQDLSLSSNILTISGLSSPTQINLAPYAGTNTDEQDLQFLDNQISLSGDPDNTIIDLNPYLDNTDLLAGIEGSEGSVLKYFPVDGGWQASTDFVDDADNDPANELEFPETATFGDVMKFDDGGNWSPAQDQVNDADSDPENEIELPSTTTSGYVMKYNGTSWIASPDNTADGDTSPTNEIEFPSDATTGYVMKFNGTSWTPQADATGGSSSQWNEGSDTFGSFVEYGGRAKALNLIGASVILTEIELSEPILKQEIFKSAKTILVNVVDGVTLNGIDPGITGQEVTFVNIGSGQITFDNRSASNLFLPASTITLSQGGTLTLMFVQEEKAAFSGWVPLSGVASPIAPGK